MALQHFSIPEDPALKRRRKMAEQLQSFGTSDAPVYSTAEGLARLGAGLIGGYQAGSVDRAEQERSNRLAEALSRTAQEAITPQPGQEKMSVSQRYATGLSKIPEFAPQATQMQLESAMEQEKAQREAEAKDAEYRRDLQMEREKYGMRQQTADQLFKGTAPAVQFANYQVRAGEWSPAQAALYLGSRVATGPGGEIQVISPEAILGQPVQSPELGAQAQMAAGQVAPGIRTIRPGTGQKFTEDQTKSAGFADRMIAAQETLDKMGNVLKDVIPTASEAIPFGGGKFIQSPEYQVARRAKEDFITAVLRKESGAKIDDSEFAREDIKYFPQPGDKPEVIEAKKKARELAINSMRRAAGPALTAPIPGVPQRPAEPPEQLAKMRGETPQQVAQAPIQITSDEEYAALPSGTKFITLDGKPGTKR